MTSQSVHSFNAVITFQVISSPGYTVRLCTKHGHRFFFESGSFNQELLTMLNRGLGFCQAVRIECERVFISQPRDSAAVVNGLRLAEWNRFKKSVEQYCLMAELKGLDYGDFTDGLPGDVVTFIPVK